MWLIFTWMIITIGVAFLYFGIELIDMFRGTSQYSLAGICLSIGFLVILSVVTLNKLSPLIEPDGMNQIATWTFFPLFWLLFFLGGLANRYKYTNGNLSQSSSP